MRLRPLCFVLALGLAVGFLSGAAVAAGSTSSPDAVTQARQYVASGDMDGAIEYLSTYL
jgi:hypothetical protein